MSERVITYPKEEFEGLIFDLDGTLIDSMPAHFSAMRQALEAVSYTHLTLPTKA